jgi:hypothetical protein
MISPVATASRAKRAAVILTLLAMLAAGCGSSVGGSAARASIDLDPAPGSTSGTCATTVLSVLGDVATRVYNEGVASERTEVALRLVEHSIPLREAVEHGNSQEASAAAAALLATGHLTNLTVLRGKQTLINVGAAHALAPLHGSILSAKGVPIASFVTSVWADSGFIDEMQGVAEGEVALREGNHPVAGSFVLPAGELPPAGTFTKQGIAYQYTCAGAPMKTRSSTRSAASRTSSTRARAARARCFRSIASSRTRRCSAP